MMCVIDVQREEVRSTILPALPKSTSRRTMLRLAGDDNAEPIGIVITQSKLVIAAVLGVA